MARSKWELKDIKTISDKHVDRLMKEAKKISRRVHLAVVLTWNGALRACELLHLRARDFNFETSKVSIVPAKKAGLKKIKGPDGQMRVIDRPLPKAIDYPIPSEAMDVANAWIEEEKLDHDDWIFKGRTSKSCKVVKYNCPGGHLSKRWLQETFDGLARTVGIKVKGRGVHCLKHARLTHVAEKSKDPYLVRDVGRHEDIAMSSEYVRYVDLSEKIQKMGGKV